MSNYLVDKFEESLTRSKTLCSTFTIVARTARKMPSDGIKRPHVPTGQTPERPTKEEKLSADELPAGVTIKEEPVSQIDDNSASQVNMSMSTGATQMDASMSQMQSQMDINPAMQTQMDMSPAMQSQVDMNPASQIEVISSTHKSISSYAASNSTFCIDF